MSDSKELIDTIDQLEVKFSEELNDICISKAEVMSVIFAYFGEPIAAVRHGSYDANKEDPTK